MEEGAKEERVEKPVTEDNGPDEEVENKKKEEGEKVGEEEEEQVESCSSDEKGKKAEEAVKENEANEKTDDEKGPSVAKKEVVEKDVQEGEESPKSQMAKEQKEEKEQKDKEPPKKAPISSFFGEEEFAFALCLHQKEVSVNVLCFYQLGETAKYCSAPTSAPLSPYLIFVPPPPNSSQKSRSEDGETRREWRSESGECREEGFSRGEQRHERVRQSATGSYKQLHLDMPGASPASLCSHLCHLSAAELWTRVHVELFRPPRPLTPLATAFVCQREMGEANLTLRGWGRAGIDSYFCYWLILDSLD